MDTPYLCPSCKSNRVRFAILDQNPLYVKLDPQTGQMVQQFDREQLDIFHIPYQGSRRRVQCGVCGVLDDEQRFITMAIKNPRNM